MNAERYRIVKDEMIGLGILEESGELIGMTKTFNAIVQEKFLETNHIVKALILAIVQKLNCRAEEKQLEEYYTILSALDEIRECIRLQKEF